MAAKIAAESGKPILLIAVTVRRSLRAGPGVYADQGHGNVAEECHRFCDHGTAQ
jgi:hypothetical protein